MVEPFIVNFDDRIIKLHWNPYSGCSILFRCLIVASWSTQLFKEEQDCQFLKKWWNAAAATNRSPPRQSSSLYYSCMLDLKNILVLYPAWESELHFHLWATDGKAGGLGRAEGGVGRHVDALGLRGQGGDLLRSVPCVTVWHWKIKSKILCAREKMIKVHLVYVPRMMKNIMGHLPDLWYNYKTLLKYFGCHTVTFDRSDITKSSLKAI